MNAYGPVLVGVVVGFILSLLTATVTGRAHRRQALEARTHAERREAYLKVLDITYRVVDRAASIDWAAPEPARGVTIDDDLNYQATALMVASASPKVRALARSLMEGEKAWFEAGRKWKTRAKSIAAVDQRSADQFLAIERELQNMRDKLKDLEACISAEMDGESPKDAKAPHP